MQAVITYTTISNPNMGPRLFNGTFYVLSKQLNVETVMVRLNPVQSGLVDNIMATECMQQLKYELGSVKYHQSNRVYYLLFFIMF